MKKILVMILVALIVANISACNYVPENKTDNTFKNTDTIESTNEITNDSEVRKLIMKLENLVHENEQEKLKNKFFCVNF